MNRTENKYLYNGKELNNKEFSHGSGLEEYDLGARFYDPQIGGFHSIDPLAEYMRRWSPYVYGFDQPVRFADGTGMSPEDPKKYTSDEPTPGSASAGTTLPPVTVTAKVKKKEEESFIGNLWGAAKEVASYVPFVGSAIQIGEGIYHGDLLEAGLGVLALGVDVFTVGEGGEALRLAEKGLQTLAEDEVKEIAEKNLAEAAEEIELHHSDPRFMGGEEKQELTHMTKSEHRELHKDLNDHLKKLKDGNGNHMRPQRGNPGSRIRQNFTRQQRIQGMKDFYKGPGAKYAKPRRIFLNNILDCILMTIGYLVTVPDIKCDMLEGMQLGQCAKFSNIYDLNIINPSFKIKSKKYNISCTYDGFTIVSENFKQFCEKERYAALEFIALPNAPLFYWLKVNNILEYDAMARGTQFLNYNANCKGFEEIIGATPVRLKYTSPLTDNFFRTDICFGSFAGKSPLYLIGENTKKKLVMAGFKEIYFEKILDKY